MSKPMGRITSGSDNRCKVITGEATDDERNDQDIAQRFHLNNSQATLHYFVAYFISSEELYHNIMSYVIILDTSGV